MPKRKHDDNKEDKWRKKIRKYEQKLNKKRRRQDDTDEEYLESNGGASTWSSPDRSPPPAIPATAMTAAGISAGSATPTVVAPACSAPLAPPLTAPAESPAMSEKVLWATDPSQMMESADISNANVDNTPDILAADPELLKVLGDFEAEIDEWGPNIVTDLTKRWESILRQGIKKETREELMKKYLLPKNCPLMKSPMLNPELAAMLNESARNRDSRVQKKQAQIGCVLSILGKTMSGILTKSCDTTEILRLLTDATKLLSDSHYLETVTRRFLVTPMVDKTLIEPLRDRKRDSHLFGENLGEFIKSSRVIQKTGKSIQSTASTSTLNYKGPPSHQQYHRGIRTQANRGGGSKTSSSYRRRGAAQTSGMRRIPQASPAPPAAARHGHKQSGTTPTANRKQ